MTKTVVAFAPAAARSKNIKFSTAVKMFGTQVEANPVIGQRNHKVQNAAGRKHITQVNGLPPTTQMILQAVEYAGAMKHLPMKLIDGYHRLDNWMEKNACPFPHLILIIHTIEASSLAEAERKTDELAVTIDAKPAAKSNTDRLTAALRDGGLDAISQAYLRGTNVTTYLKHTVGMPSMGMHHLIRSTQDKLVAHQAMDSLFHFTEQTLTANERRDYFNNGVAEAVFKKLDTLADPLVAVGVLINALQLAHGQRVPGASAASVAICNKLQELASPAMVNTIRAVGNKTAQYHYIGHELRDVLALLEPSRKAKRAAR